MPDLEGRCFVKRRGALHPVDFMAEEMLAKLPEGGQVLITVRRPRNIKAHNWFMALLHKVWDNTRLWPTKEKLLVALKFDIGHTEEQMALDGSVIVTPKSIDFASMSEDEFQDFKERSLDALATKVLGCDPTELMDEVDSTQKRAA